MLFVEGFMTEHHNYNVEVIGIMQLCTKVIHINGYNGLNKMH